MVTLLVQNPLHHLHDQFQCRFSHISSFSLCLPAYARAPNFSTDTTEAVGITDRNDAKIWIIRHQFGRRNLVPYARAELALMLEEVFAAKAGTAKREALSAWASTVERNESSQREV